MARQAQTSQRDRNERTKLPVSAQMRGAAAAPQAERDEIYGVVSVLYHALQGADTYRQYIDDARRAGDEELVEFFESCRSEESERATRAKALLMERLEEEEGGSEDDEDDEDDEGEDEEDEEEE